MRTDHALDVDIFEPCESPQDCLITLDSPQITKELKQTKNLGNKYLEHATHISGTGSSSKCKRLLSCIHRTDSLLGPAPKMDTMTITVSSNQIHFCAGFPAADNEYVTSYNIGGGTTIDVPLNIQACKFENQCLYAMDDSTCVTVNCGWQNYLLVGCINSSIHAVINSDRSLTNIFFNSLHHPHTSKVIGGDFNTPKIM